MLFKSPQIMQWGRRIHGPTLPGKGARCNRRSPLTPAELEEVVGVVAEGRLKHKTVNLSEHLKTRDWGSVVAIMQSLNEKLGWPSAGWKIGAASEEIRRAEGVPEPQPGQLIGDRVFESPAYLPSNLFINYRNSECEFAFRLAYDLPVRGVSYTETEVADSIEAMYPAIEIGDTVFEDWYGASGYHGTSLDNGGAAAFVYGAAIHNWRAIDLSNAKIDLYLNGDYIKSGYGSAAMGHPLTSLTWLTNWLNARGKGLFAGEFVSTGTCTGHFFAAQGDRVDADFGKIGKVTATYE